MAIANYTDLKAALANWANRSDLTNEIIDAIMLAEGRMYDDMLLKDMETDSPLTLTAGLNYVALPAGYISPIAFYLVISGLPVKLTEMLPQESPRSISNTLPRKWAIDGPNILFDCPADQNYSAIFRCNLKSNLSGSVATNYLLARRPDVYLSASLSELSRKTKDAELFNAWEPKYTRSRDALKAADNRARGMVQLRTDIPVSVIGNILSGQ